jgi:hypothetical protein
MAERPVIRVATYGAAEAYRTTYTRAHANGYDWSLREQQRIADAIRHGGSDDWAPDEWLAAQVAVERALTEISGNLPLVQVTIEVTDTSK